jgi:hypothetical protein
MSHCIEYGDALWATAANLVMRYGSLRQIWLCGKFGYALWATAAGLVLLYGSLRRMNPYSKDLRQFMLCGPKPRICLCTLGCIARFCYALWAIADDLVMCFGP